MSRPIKFRVWDGKKMVSPEIGDEVNSLNNAISLSTKKYGNLMQFTGLFDKNGKEIWEGDIVSLPDPDTLTEVTWNDGSFRILKDSYINQDRIKHWRVIGNIYEAGG